MAFGLGNTYRTGTYYMENFDTLAKWVSIQFSFHNPPTTLIKTPSDYAMALRCKYNDEGQIISADHSSIHRLGVKVIGVQKMKVLNEWNTWVAHCYCETDEVVAHIRLEMTDRGDLDSNYFHLWQGINQQAKEYSDLCNNSTVCVYPDILSMYHSFLGNEMKMSPSYSGTIPKCCIVREPEWVRVLYFIQPIYLGLLYNDKGYYRIVRVNEQNKTIPVSEMLKSMAEKERIESQRMEREKAKTEQWLDTLEGVAGNR